jgi:hypothetical protein
MFDDRLARLLDQQGERVGLTRTHEDPNSQPGLALPESAAIWSGQHAILVICPVEPESAAFIATAAACVRWLGDVLDGWRRRKGRLFDGYLVLALSEAATGGTVDYVKQFELDTRVCRRHVVWPDPDGTWMRRLAEVTVLGLPTAGAVAPPDGELGLPESARQCLSWYDAPNSNITRVFEQLEARIATEARSEVQRAD